MGSRKSHREGILPSQKGIRYYSIIYANALNGVFLYNYISVNNFDGIIACSLYNILDDKTLAQFS